MKIYYWMVSFYIYFLYHKNHIVKVYLITFYFFYKYKNNIYKKITEIIFNFIYTVDELNWGPEGVIFQFNINAP
jgi:hypothetical protein